MPSTQQPLPNTVRLKRPFKLFGQIHSWVHVWPRLGLISMDNVSTQNNQSVDSADTFLREPPPNVFAPILVNYEPTGSGPIGWLQVDEDEGDGVELKLKMKKIV